MWTDNVAKTYGHEADRETIRLCPQKLNLQNTQKLDLKPGQELYLSHTEKECF